MLLLRVLYNSCPDFALGAKYWSKFGPRARVLHLPMMSVRKPTEGWSLAGASVELEGGAPGRGGSDPPQAMWLSRGPGRHGNAVQPGAGVNILRSERGERESHPREKKKVSCGKAAVFSLWLWKQEVEGSRERRREGFISHCRCDWMGFHPPIHFQYPLLP